MGMLSQIKIHRQAIELQLPLAWGPGRVRGVNRIDRPDRPDGARGAGGTMD